MFDRSRPQCLADADIDGLRSLAAWLAQDSGRTPQLAAPSLADNGGTPVEHLERNENASITCGRVVADPAARTLRFEGAPDALANLAGWFDDMTGAPVGHHGHLEPYDGHPWLCAASLPVVLTHVNPMYRCPCCGSAVFGEARTCEICPVCFWEDDGSETGGGANAVSQVKARENFARFGACEERFVELRRPADASPKARRALIEVLPSLADPGRRWPDRRGCQIDYAEGSTSCTIRPLFGSSVVPGAPAQVLIELMFEEQVGHLIDGSHPIVLREGNRIVGRGTWIR